MEFISLHKYAEPIKVYVFNGNITVTNDLLTGRLDRFVNFHMRMRANK